MTRKLTQAEFVSRAKKIHGDKYDYSNSIYINSASKLIVTCLKHGQFLTSPINHIMGKLRGCSKCGYDSVRKKKSYTHDEYIAKAIAKHHNYYDYSKTLYTNSKNKIVVTCLKHGDFNIDPVNHLAGTGCFKCGIERSVKYRKLSESDIRRVHGDRFTYDLSNHTNLYKKIRILCLEHGWFECSVSVHMRNKNGGCKLCRRAKYDKSIAERPERIKKRHAERQASDQIYQLKRRMRSRIRQIFCKMGKQKNCKTENIVGCSWEQFYTHIERQFTKGMSWDRLDEIHIDHIIPLATAQTTDDIIRLNHFTNLRPLWAKDNLRKNRKVQHLL